MCKYIKYADTGWLTLSIIGLGSIPTTTGGRGGGGVPFVASRPDNASSWAKSWDSIIATSAVPVAMSTTRSPGRSCKMREGRREMRRREGRRGGEEGRRRGTSRL